MKIWTIPETLEKAEKTAIFISIIRFKATGDAELKETN